MARFGHGPDALWKALGALDEAEEERDQLRAERASALAQVESACQREAAARQREADARAAFLALRAGHLAEIERLQAQLAAPTMREGADAVQTSYAGRVEAAEAELASARARLDAGIRRARHWRNDPMIFTKACANQILYALEHGP